MHPRTVSQAVHTDFSLVEAPPTSRPSIESQTNENEIVMQTETLALTATPLANGYVKAKTGDDTTDAVYQNWYSAVYLPTAEEEQPAELRAMGQLVSGYLDFAERQAKREIPMTMEDWESIWMEF